MEKDEFYYLGKILKTYGNHGHLLVLLDVDDPDRYRSVDMVFLDIHKEKIPFFIESLELKPGQKAVVKFLDVNTVVDAEAFRQLELFLPVSALPKLRGNKFYHHEVKGFKVVDERLGEIGQVDRILEMPVQPLFRILKGEKEILVPVVDEIIRKVDRKRRTIFIAAPEGLIDLYL